MSEHHVRVLRPEEVARAKEEAEASFRRRLRFLHRPMTDTEQRAALEIERRRQQQWHE